jgi:histidine triad (HIT) family protein
MNMNECIFCKIINKELPADIVYETKEIIVFKDIKPVMPVHLLIVPKKHIISIDYIEIKDKILMGQLILTAQKISQEMNLKGYKLQINVGRKGGQIVDHLHMHLISEKQ